MAYGDRLARVVRFGAGSGTTLRRPTRQAALSAAVSSPSGRRADPHRSSSVPGPGETGLGIFVNIFIKTRLGQWGREQAAQFVVTNAVKNRIRLGGSGIRHRDRLLFRPHITV
jgi:hypothetical protein